MTTNLYAASNQWANRPVDERFWTLEDMFERTNGYAISACQATAKMGDLIVEPTPSNDLTLRGSKGAQAKLTNWAFRQLATRVSAPAGYLASLPAPVVATCLNTGLDRFNKDNEDTRLLFHNQPETGLVCRSLTSENYSRIWNRDIVKRLLDLPEQGWQVPPARPMFRGEYDADNTRLATEEDCLKLRGGMLSIKPGDVIGPAGLYASDHDMFAFLVNEQVIDDGTDCGLGRGVFVSNSEVGKAAFKVVKFLYAYVCANHIVWDAKEVKELKIVHRGSANSRFGSQMSIELRNYSDQSSSVEEARIKMCKRIEIGGNKDEVLDKIFGKKTLGLTKGIIGEAYDHAVQHEHIYKASPRSIWGMVQGVTALSRKLPHADDRATLDKAAGKMMTINF